MLEATMVSPSETGPCEAEWQLEDADGIPLAPPLLVQGVVGSCAGEGSSFLLEPRSSFVSQRGGAMPPSSFQSQSGTPPLLQAQTFPHTSRPVTATKADTPSSREEWPRKFEEFFGMEVCSRLLQPEGPEREVNRLLTMVWEHIKAHRLQTQTQDIFNVDDTMYRMFSVSLKPGTKQIRRVDVQPVVSHTVKKYVQSKRVVSM